MANTVSRHDLNIFCGTSNPDLSAKIADYCGVQLGRVDFSTFNNGESELEIKDSVRGKDVYIVQSSGKDVNNNFMSLVLFIQACKLSGARSITAVLPLLPYTRRDYKSPEKQKPIAAKMIAVMLEAAGAQKIITIDMHSPQTEGFFNIPVDCLTAKHCFEEWIRTNVPEWEESVIVSPDAGGTRRAGALADLLNLPVAIIHRDRINQEHVISGTVADKQVILVDDIADTCFTIKNAVQHLVEVGRAKEIIILITHALFSEHPILEELLERNEVVKIVVTNSVKKLVTHQIILSAKVEVIDVSKVIGEAIRRNHYGESLTASSLR